jgi:hypothetical protein
MKRSLIWALLFVLVLSLSPIQPASADPGFWSQKPSVIWNVTITPGPYWDYAFCAATWGNYVFAVGEHNVSGSDSEFMVYKLSKSTGEVVQYWSLNPSNLIERPFDGIIVSNYLYIAGIDAEKGDYKWDIIRFDVTNLNSYIRKTSNPTTKVDLPRSIATDGSNVYVAGAVSGGDCWRIEKYDLDLNFIGYKEFNQTKGGDEAYAIGVNPKTGQVWVLGGENNDTKSIVRILDPNLNLIKSIDLATSPQSLVPYVWFFMSIAFDSLGNGYAAVGSTVLKLSPDGTIMKRISLQGNITKLVSVSDYIYAVGRDSTGPKIYILNRELQLVSTFALQGLFRGAAFDSSNLYLAGYKKISSSDYDWMVYKIDPLMSRLHLIVRGMDNSIYYRWLLWGQPNWSSWVKLPGSTPDAPAAIEYGSTLMLVVRGGDNGIWQGLLQLSTGEFLKWQKLPGSTPSRPAIAPDMNNYKVYLVVRGMDNGIYYGEAGGPGLLKLPGSTIDAPAAAVLDNRLHIVVRGGDGSIYHGQLDLTSGKWLGWAKLTGSTPSAPSLTTDGKNLYLAVRGNDNGIYIKVWTGAWGSWERIPTGSTQSPPSVTWYNGMLYVFVKGMDNGIYYCWKTAGGSWSSWYKLTGSTPSAPAVASP